MPAGGTDAQVYSVSIRGMADLVLSWMGLTYLMGLLDCTIPEIPTLLSGDALE